MSRLQANCEISTLLAIAGCAALNKGSASGLLRQAINAEAKRRCALSSDVLLRNSAAVTQEAQIVAELRRTADAKGQQLLSRAKPIQSLVDMAGTDSSRRLCMEALKAGRLARDANVANGLVLDRAKNYW
jgi:hypothetical protein